MASLIVHLHKNAAKETYPRSFPTSFSGDRKRPFFWDTCNYISIRLRKVHMPHIKAIGFDLFNTLLFIEPLALDEAVERLILSLNTSFLSVKEDSFKKAHKEAALRFINETRIDGRETHNRFWISAALMSQGYEVDPDDSRITEAVDAYFSAFMGRCHLIPGTIEMLKALKGTHRLGLLSNFTHPPAMREIIDSLGLTSHFDVVLISGELGYRKPHPIVFRRLLEELGVKNTQILYVGDDPEPDILGPTQAGIRPVWFTYVRDKGIPSTPGIAGLISDDPKGDVTRISEWSDLFSLLEKGL
jgi:putative hydrolase of the HAD superfamily